MDNVNLSKQNNLKHLKFKKLRLISINVNSIISNKRRYNFIHFLTKNNIDIAHSSMQLILFEFT